VDVPDQAGDDVYLPLLRRSMEELEGRLKASAAPQFVAPLSAPARTMDGVRVSGPDPSLGVSLVLYQAGVDPLAQDRLGRLKLTRTGLHERNDVVLRWCEARGLPVAVTMGGGYARPIELSARCHVDVFVQAAQSWGRRQRAWDAFVAAAAKEAGVGQELAATSK
jgi:acetoin utilization deacetylase AcuC-like enzyme